MMLVVAEITLHRWWMTGMRYWRNCADRKPKYSWTISVTMSVYPP